MKGDSFGQNRDFVSILDSKSLFITSIIVETPLRDSLDYSIFYFLIIFYETEILPRLASYSIFYFLIKFL